MSYWQQRSADNMDNKQAIAESFLTILEPLDEHFETTVNCLFFSTSKPNKRSCRIFWKIIPPR